MAEETQNTSTAGSSEGWGGLLSGIGDFVLKGAQAYDTLFNDGKGTPGLANSTVQPAETVGATKGEKVTGANMLASLGGSPVLVIGGVLVAYWLLTR